ncbi:MAG: hypothetical protein M1837_003327 [Sclerophora amabilis]|nr:MAG: hypothetical protein M1837_003327 [Sclerophora amabilis]
MASNLLKQESVCIEFLDSTLPIYSTEKPYYSNVPFIEAGAMQTNVKSVKCAVSLLDIRGYEQHFSLDVNGFELIRHKADFNEWCNGPQVVRDVYPEIANLLKRRLGKEVRIVVFDHTLRRSATHGIPAGTQQEQHDGTGNYAPPSRVAHVDQTYEATVEQIRLDFGSEADKILSGRFRIINIWRPLQSPVQQHPLILCDYRTAQQDAIPCDLLYPHTVTELSVFRYSDEQRWYFMDNQTSEELWLLKIMDSESRRDSTIAEYAAHTSFFREDPLGILAPRESIEFRATLAVATRVLRAFSPRETVSSSLDPTTPGPRAAAITPAPKLPLQQPWREWLAAELKDSDGKAGAAIDRPWLHWKPNEDDPSEKPWLHWGEGAAARLDGGPTSEMMGTYPVVNHRRLVRS